MTFLDQHLDKVGLGGSLFAALCCLGFPALLSILSAVGLGFLFTTRSCFPFSSPFWPLPSTVSIAGTKNTGEQPQ